MKKLLLVILLCAGVSAQQGALPETATFSGVVVQSGTSTPVSGVAVSLIPETGQTRTGNSDTDGKFSITGISVGRYSVTLTRTGFVRPRGSPAPATLSFAAGQLMKDVRLQLVAASAIAGRVFDPNGDPSTDTIVALLRPEYRFGRHILNRIQGQRVDSKGAYRFFGLEPGDYFVAVEESGIISRFYPGVSDPAGAIPVVLQAETENPAIDFHLSQRNLHTVRFKVTELQYGTYSRRNIRLVRRLSDGTDLRVDAASTSGMFKKVDTDTYISTGLTAGSYLLYYDIDGGASLGRLSFDIADRDVDAGVLTASPGFSVSGHVLVAGRLAGQGIPQSLSVRLQPMDNGYDLSPGKSARVASDGSFLFEIRGNNAAYVGVVPGPYQIEIVGLPRDFYVSPARVAVQEGANGPLEITIDGSGGIIEGIAEDAKHDPAGDSTVVLIPAKTHRNAFVSFKTAITDQDGKFSIRGVAPGDYSVLAWQEIKSGAWLNGEFLKSVEDRGAKLTVTAGSTISVTVRVM